MEDNEFELKWTNVLTVGVPEMDAEHKALIARVNQLNQAVIKCRDKATIKRVMDSMLAEAAIHFRNEEQLLLEWKYPERAVHAIKHSLLMQQLHHIRSEFETPATTFMGELKGLQINQLLIDHLLKEDMKYRDFLRASVGLKQTSQEDAFPGA